jgi:hypothetical protein
VVTDETVAVKLAVVAPEATVTEAGTLTAELLLARLTANPPLGATVFSVTVQLSVPAPAIEPLVQLSAVKVGALAAIPVPLRLTAIVSLAEALLVIVRRPEAAPLAVGEKPIFKVTLPPAAIEIGRLPSPLTEKALPDTLIFETVTAAVPALTKDALALAFVPSDIAPKLTVFGDACKIRVLLAALRLSPPQQSKIRTYRKRTRRSCPGLEKRTRKCASLHFSRERSQVAVVLVVTSCLNGEQNKISRNFIVYAPINESCFFMARSHGTARAWVLVSSQPAH